MSQSLFAKAVFLLFYSISIFSSVFDSNATNRMSRAHARTQRYATWKRSKKICISTVDFGNHRTTFKKKREVEEKEAEIKQQQADESLREGDTDNGRLNPIRETFILWFTLLCLLSSSVVFFAIESKKVVKRRPGTTKCVRNRSDPVKFQKVSVFFCH